MPRPLCVPDTGGGRRMCIEPNTNDSREDAFEVDHDGATRAHWTYISQAKDSNSYEKVPPDGLNSSDGCSQATGLQWDKKQACLCCAFVVGALAFSGMAVNFLRRTPSEAVHRGSRSREGAQSSSLGPLAAVSSMSAETYDCEDSYFDWKRAWSPEKKLWCCQHQHRGCVGTTAAVTTVSPSASRGCDTICTYDTKNASCRTRIQFAAQYVLFLKKDACAISHVLVLEQCPGCSVCNLEEAGCVAQVASASLGPTTLPAMPFSAAEAQAAASLAVPAAPATAAAPAEHSAAAAPAAECEAACRHGGESLSCAKRVRRAAHGHFAGRPKACELAMGMVLQQCSACSTCPLASTNCTVEAQRTATSPGEAVAPQGTTLQPTYDCLAGASAADGSGWPDDQREWCCQHESRGCPQTVTPEPYNCRAEDWADRRGWSEAKESWCCEHHQLHGCSEPL